MSRGWYFALVYLSGAGLLLALYRADYLTMPVVLAPGAAIASLAALAIGFAASAAVWHRTLARVGLDVAFVRALAATGLSVFAKYLPGKLWLLVGRAAYVAEPGSGGFLAASAASVSSQLGSLWVALALGVVGLAALGGPLAWIAAVAAVWAGLTLIAFSAPVHALAMRLASRVLGRHLDLPLLSLGDVLVLSPWYLLTWAAWSVGFYLVCRGLLPGAVPWAVGLAFPLAAAAGMFAVFLPGGLGAREGVLATSLTLAGFTLVDATSVAVAARLWMLVGEAGIFVAGVAADRSRRRERTPPAPGPG